MGKKLVGKAKAKARKNNRTNVKKVVDMKGAFKGMMDTIPDTPKAFPMNEIYNACPTMIHEKDYVSMDCCLCGAEMETVHDTNNPEPITERCYAKEALETGNPDRCCNKCDKTKVLPARLGATKGVNVNAVMDYINSGKAEIKTIPVSELINMRSWNE